MVVVWIDRNCVSFYVDDGDEGKEEDVLLLSFLKFGNEVFRTEMAAERRIGSL